MVSVNGRTRKQTVLPTKIECAYIESEAKRDGNKTSRQDYAAGFEDGYEAALSEMRMAQDDLARRMRKELRAP